MKKLSKIIYGVFSGVTVLTFSLLTMYGLSGNNVNTNNNSLATSSQLNLIKTLFDNNRDELKKILSSFKSSAQKSTCIKHSPPESVTPPPELS